MRVTENKELKIFIEKISQIVVYTKGVKRAQITSPKQWNINYSNYV
jgi:hypothetical protein